MPVAVRAEDDALAAATRRQAQRPRAAPTPRRGWPRARSRCDLAAIAGGGRSWPARPGCALHIVHVSSPEGVALITEARAQRVDVTAETCPHYLLLNDKDVAKPRRLGQMRAADSRRETAPGALDRASAPAAFEQLDPITRRLAPDMKTSKNFFEIWGGIGGVQHGTQLLLNECAATLEDDLPTLAAVLARNVARRFRIEERKGSIALGRDADFLDLLHGGSAEDRRPMIFGPVTASAPMLAGRTARMSRTRLCAAWRRGADDRSAPCPRRGRSSCRPVGSL